MVFVASKERSRLTQGSPPGDLCLRVVGSARDGQVVRLTAAKCAIGSAEGCTLRLRARGVRPVHCLVLRGTHGTVARSWAPNTQLNGEPFRDAVLEAGDRLTIGPVEFEVLEAEGPPAGPTDAGRTVVLDRRPADRSLHTDRTLVSARPKHSKRWRSHVRKLVGEVRKLRGQIDTFQANAQAAPPAGVADADEIQEKLEGYRQQNQQWEATLQGLQGELDSRERQLASELADLERARQSLESERRDWQRTAEAKQAELADQERIHREASEKLESAQTAFATEREQHESGVQSDRQQLAEREAALQSLTQQQSETAGQLEVLQHRSEELDARARTLEGREAELAEAQAASRRATEELNACRASFEAQQIAMQNQLDEQRAVLATQEQTQREAISTNEQRQHELEAAQAELAQRKSELEQAEASLAHDRGILLEGEQARAAELQQSAEALQRRESELATRETELAERATKLAERETALAERAAQVSETPTDHSQEAFQTIVAEPYGFDVSELESRRAELEAAEAANRTAAEELAAAKSQFEVQQAEALAASQRQSQEFVATSDELTQRRNAVAEAETQLRTERESLFNERLGQEAELRQASEALQKQRAEFETRTAEFEARAAEAETHATAEPAASTVDPALASELAEKETRLAELQVEIEREREALLAEREEFDHASTRKSARLDADADELKRDRDALEVERNELAAEREAFEEQRRRESDRREAEPLKQMFAPREDEEDDEENEEEALNEFSRSQPPQRRQVSLDTVRAEAGDTSRAQPQGGDEDVSIEDYMAALLNRTRSSQGPAVIQPMETPRRNKRKSDVQPVAEPEPVEASDESKEAAREVPVLDMPATLVQLERRKLPEVRPDMNVLREIGITHARSAIATHGQQRSLRQAYGTLGTSLVCFVAAFLVFYFGTHTVFHLTGMAIVVIGIYWLGTSIWAVNKVLTSMKQRRGGLRATLAEIDAEIEALRKEAEAELEEAK